MGIGQHAFFGRGALAAQTAALADGKLCADFGFHQPRQREVEIVAAQEQMLADRGARELHAVARPVDTDQREVAGSAADIADQHQLPVKQTLLGLREMVGDPGIKRRRRFFE